MTGADAGRVSEPDVVNRLHWGARRYFAVLVVTVLAAVALSISRPANGGDRMYEAAALVVATTLEINSLQLPRTVDAVFNAGSVAESVSSELPYAGPPNRLIPDIIRLEPLNDTIAVRVVGRSAEPSVAADLANVAALSLVAELNRLGPGVGAFALQDRARLPSAEDDDSSVLAPLAVGVMSGGALGLGLVGLLLLMRRPVIEGDEAAAVVGAPLLVSLELPRRSRSVDILESVSGLSLLAKQLFPGEQRLCALVGIGADTRVRLEVMGLVAVLLGRTRSAYLVVPVPDHRGLADRTASAPNVRVIDSWFLPPMNSRDPGAAPPADGETVVLFGLSAQKFDVPQMLPAGIRSLLFVTQGLRRTELESAAGQFGPGGVDGIVFVRRPPWWRWWLDPRRVSTSRAAPGAPQGPNTSRRWLRSDDRPWKGRAAGARRGKNGKAEARAAAVLRDRGGDDGGA